MEDFIFGTLATDELKLVHHRAARQGIQHNHDLMPRDPAPGEPIAVRARTGRDLPVDGVALYYTTDGTWPAGARGQAQTGVAQPMTRVAVEWDTLAWGYVAVWEATIPPQPEGTVVRYRIGAWAEGAPGDMPGDVLEVFADWPSAQIRAERAAAAFFRQEHLSPDELGDLPGTQTFTFHVDQLAPPAWGRDAVIYHIFVDRFFPGEGCTWQQTDDLNGICGGTLDGVRQKLDYIEELGATCIWLSPIFVSPTHHGYDALDYYQVEPRLGGDAALHALVEAAHARGIRILLDYACNHLSDQHPIFQQALRDPASPYREWFYFDDSPHGYRAFFDVSSMPQVNVENPGARQYLIDIARYWLREFDVDGYRLDYANGPGPDFWSDFWAACKDEKPDAYCFGEVIDAPDAQRAYVGRLDGCLDFHLGDALRKTFGWKTWTEADLERFIERHRAFFPAAFAMPTFLDNHDMDRFLFIAGGDKEALKRAAAVQMRQPGPPIIFYGTEIGLSQRGNKDGIVGLEISRTPMAWGDAQDRDLFAYYQALIRARRARCA